METDLYIHALMEQFAPQEIAHGQRVSAIVGKMLESRKCSGFLATLRKAAFSHDIGKPSTKIPHLYENYILTESERTQVEQHPQIGFQILESHGIPAEICQLVLRHHKGVSRKGYPNEDIPKIKKKIKDAAQIIAVAEAFDTMLSSCYAPPMTVDQALKELRNGVGTQFGAEPVLLFDNCLNQNKSFFSKLYPHIQG
jgi:putative nucleotidyltransferase with HDIG domain